MCKTCKHTLFMTGVACHCSDVDVSCLRCVRSACDCKISDKYLLSWWTRDDLSRFVTTAETYLKKLRAGEADAVSKTERKKTKNRVQVECLCCGRALLLKVVVVVVW